MFIDRTVVTFIAGKGGSGCVSYRREKFVPKGGPDGGNGGDGGSIILVSRKGNNSLIDFKFTSIVLSDKGKNGSGSNKIGRKGEDRVLLCPPGTVIKTYPDEKLIFDFTEEDVEFVIAQGGKGGRGNAHFKTSTHQTPKFSQPGGKGEKIKVVLELKLIAFAGLVGLPNAGKSTLISRISGAKPKIADYPFTTLTPNLGVVYNDYESMVVADIPGIIEGAHQGEGMGLDFLRHIERNKLLIFLLDVSPYAELEPLETFKLLQKEVNFYKTEMVKKKYIVVANKIDLLGDDREKLDVLKNYCQKEKIFYMEISAMKEKNLEELKVKLFDYYNEK